MWLFPFQILSREYWTPDNTRPAVLTGTDMKTSVSQIVRMQEQALQFPGGVRNSPVYISFLFILPAWKVPKSFRAPWKCPNIWSQQL